MKLGILGTGMIVREFLPWLAGPDCPFTVQALCSTQRSAPVADEMCEQYGIPQHTTNYFELLQWVDVIYLAVPNLQHYRYAKVALEAGKHVIVEKPMACTAAQTEELAALARRKKVFLFEAMTTQYLENYNKIRELLPRIGRVKLVQCNFSQYSSRYDAFCAGETPVSFDPECAGGALMDLNVYNISYIVGLFGEPNQVHYLPNMERGIDTSGILTMEYNSFKAVSMAAKDCGAPARYVIQGTKGYILQKSTANWCGGVTFHPNQGKEEHFNLNGGRPRQAAEFHAFARAIEGGDQELCSRMLDTSVAVSRVIDKHPNPLRHFVPAPPKGELLTKPQTLHGLPRPRPSGEVALRSNDGEGEVVYKFSSIPDILSKTRFAPYPTYRAERQQEEN